LSNIFKNYINILKSPHFFVVITPLAFAFLLQGVFLVSTPFIFMKSYSLSAFEYGLTNIITALALLFGQALTIRLIKRYSIYFAYIFGGVLTLMGGVIVAVFINLDILSMPLFLSAMFISVSGFGTTLPVGIKSIMTAFDKNMGMVSALHGFITLSFMAMGSYIFTLFRDILDMEYITILTMCIISVGLLMSTLSIYTKRYLR
jgi:DHA1 family bicyclomycin/chloramphenicol resistance-like MFS transporter